MAAAAVVGAALLIVLLDLAHQPADPPRDLSASIGTIDEGIWSHNSVNDALFGRARLDDFNPMYVSAGSALYRASYAVSGVGIRQTRFPSIAFAGLTVLLVGFLLWRVDPLAGAIAAVLLGTSGLYLSYSRLGLLETPAAAIALSGVASLTIALAGKRRWPGVLGGALMAAAVAVKPQVAAAVLGSCAGLGLWAVTNRDRRPGPTLLAAAGGFVAVAATWAVFVIAHMDDSLRSEWAWHSSGITPKLGQIFTNIRTYAGSSDGFGTRARPLLIAAAAGFVVQAAAWIARRYRPSTLAVAGAGWAAAGVATVATLPYTPSRYAVLSLPGLAITAGCGVIAARALAGALRPPRAATALAVVAVALTMIGAAGGLSAWRDWARAPEFGVRRTAAMLERETGSTDVVYGGWALLASVQAHRRVIVTHTPDINDRCPIERYGARWVLASPGDLSYLEQHYPGLVSPVNRVATSRILGRPLVLYRVPAGFVGTGCG